MRFPILLAIAALAAPFSASAGEGCHSGESVVQHIFDKADRDEDGVLTQEEYEAAGLQNFGVTFAESDLDSDGGTTMSEYLELYLELHPPADATDA